MLRLVFFTLLALAICVNAGLKGKCPWALGKYPFNESKIKGDWHLIAGTTMLGEHLSKCGKFQVHSDKTGDRLDYAITYEALNSTDGSTLKYESKSTAYKPEKGSISLGVWRKEGTEKWSGVYKQSIVATDYDSFAVFLACRHEYDAESNSFGRKLFALILGRNPTLNKDVVDTLINILSGYDVETESLQLADHSKCP